MAVGGDRIALLIVLVVEYISPDEPAGIGQKNDVAKQHNQPALVVLLFDEH